VSGCVATGSLPLSPLIKCVNNFFIYDLLIAKSRKSWRNANRKAENNTKYAHGAYNEQTIKREIPHGERERAYIHVWMYSRTPYRNRYG